MSVMRKQDRGHSTTLQSCQKTNPVCNQTKPTCKIIFKDLSFWDDTAVLSILYTVESSFGSNARVQNMPLNESPHVAHFWVYTLRKLFPVSCVDSVHQTQLLGSRKQRGEYNLLEDMNNLSCI